MVHKPDYSKIFILSGFSGVGKDSIIAGLGRTLPLERVRTTTTRPMRPGESQGHPYYFVSQEEFLRRKQAGEFVEAAQQYNSQWYGVTRAELDRVAGSGRPGIWNIEYQGVLAAKKLFPEMHSILITAPLDMIERRIRARDAHVSEAYVQERMAYTKQWLKYTDMYDHVVENPDGGLLQAIANIAAIIGHPAGSSPKTNA